MDKRVITRGMSALCATDPDIATAYADIGPPATRLRKPGLPTFISTIVSQQISAAAARSILERVMALLPNQSADDLLAVAEDELRTAGLSRQKISYLKALAAAIESGELDIDELPAMSDEQAIATITALRGFGRWSAEIYLMFSLRRRDVFPADDLALQVALGRLKGLAHKPTPAQCRKLTEHWSPWRSVGALFLWHYYRGTPQ